MSPEENIESLRTRKEGFKARVQRLELQHREAQRQYTQSIKDYNIATMNLKLEQSKS